MTKRPAKPPARRAGGRQPSELELADQARFAASPALRSLPPAFAESFHYLVARLRLTEGEPPPRCIAVVAGSHREGVSSVARALAVILTTDLHANVCLVDFDPSSPLNRSASPEQPRLGLVDVLLGDATLDDVATATTESNLKVVTTGRIDSAGGRRMARSPKLADVFDELDKTFDHVVIDVPPILLGSHALEIVRHAQAYLLVVRYGSTTTDQVRTTVAELRGMPSLGVVLNESSTKVPRVLRRLFNA